MGLDAEMTIESPTQHRPIAAALAFIAALILAAAHFAFLMKFFVPAISTPDANGYFAQARHIAAEHHTWFETESPLQFIPTHWLSSDGQRFFSKYPPGLPLIAAGVRFVFGPQASLLVNPVMASLTLLGLFLVCRTWIGTGWALLAAALMALNPAVNQQAMFAFAHTAVAFFLMWGLYAISRSSLVVADPNPRVPTPLWAFVAGLCFGITPTIRYAEALYWLAPICVILLTPRLWQRTAKSLACAALGLAVPSGALALRNHFAFGAFWRTGYAASNEQTGFGWQYFTEHFASYLRQLPADGGLVFGLGIVGLTLLCCRRATLRYGLLLALVAVPSTLLYMAYYWGPDGMSMRFLVPTLFIYAIATVWLLKLLADIWRGPAIASALIVLLITVFADLPQTRMQLQRLADANRRMAQITDAVKQHIRPGDIILADRQVEQHLDFEGDWRLADTQLVMSAGRGPRVPMGSRGTGTRTRLPVDAAAQDAVEDGAPTPGRGQVVAQRAERYRDLGDDAPDAIRDDLFAWASNARRIYWVGTRDQLERIEDVLSPITISKPLATVQVQAASGPGADGMGPGRFGPGGRRRPGAGPLGPARPGARPPGRPGARGAVLDDAPQQYVIVELTRKSG